MKRKLSLCSLLLVGLMALAARPASAAQSVTLIWDPNSETNLSNYVLAYSTTGTNWTTTGSPQVFFPVPVPGITEGTFSGLADGVTYHFAVKARNVFGLESPWSDVVSWTAPLVPPSKPTRLRVKP
jgi:hypothetical protein